MATMAKAHGEDLPDHPHGWRRYLYSTNHKDIGTMYLVFALIGGLISGVLSIGMRLELMHPGLQFFHDSHMFNVFTTAHGLIRSEEHTSELQSLRHLVCRLLPEKKK